MSAHPCGERCGMGNSDDSCDPCVMHGICHLCETEKKDREIGRLEAEVAQLRTGATLSLGCSWCDTWDIPTKEALREHAAVCPAHPGNRRAMEAEKAYFKLKCDVARQAMEDAPGGRPLDFALLAKFASGVGGGRTGPLMRAGYIRVEVTEAGLAALAEKEKTA